MTSAALAAVGRGTDLMQHARFRRDVEGLRPVAVLFGLLHHAGQLVFGRGCRGKTHAVWLATIGDVVGGSMVLTSGDAQSTATS